MPSKFVLTGGPKTGKTTVVNVLKKMGYQIVQEAAATLISEALENDEPPPWQNMSTFQKNIFILQLRREQAVKKYPTAFFDRSIIDSVGYARFYNMAIDLQAVEHVKREPYTAVFLLDFVIPFSSDRTRVEDFELANDLHCFLKKTYEDFGYKPIVVPPLSPGQRAMFICKKIREFACVNNYCHNAGSLYVPRF